MEDNTKILLAILVVITLPITIPLALVAIGMIMVVLTLVLGTIITVSSLYPLPSAIVMCAIIALVARMIYLKYR